MWPDSTRIAPGVMLALALLLAGPLLLGAGPAPAERAMALYADGRYAQAKPLLAEIDAAGNATGPLLFRLHYCQRVSGDAAARDTLLRARDRLETEVEANPDNLESAFYLANVYGATAQLSNRSALAAATTARVEAGKIRAETDEEIFWVGNLYEDQDEVDKAAVWYERVVRRHLDGDETSTSPYVVRAARLLSDRAIAAGDTEQAQRYYALMIDDPGLTAADLDRMASALARAGQYRPAAQAWKRAERLAPANANRSRYCRILANGANKVGPLPDNAPDGRPWSELSQAELDALMKELAAHAREVIVEWNATETMRDGLRRDLQARLDAKRVVFTAAALEFALRGLEIREAAFFGGYAPLIFQAKSWNLPKGAPPKVRERKQREREERKAAGETPGEGS